jgi:hypothetical protein
MKAASEFAPYSYLPAGPRGPAVVYYKLAGLLIAVGFATLFWVLVLLLLSNAVGVSMSASAVTGFGLAVAAICLVGTSVVIGDRR